MLYPFDKTEAFVPICKRSACDLPEQIQSCSEVNPVLSHWCSVFMLFHAQQRINSLFFLKCYHNLQGELGRRGEFGPKGAKGPSVSDFLYFCSCNSEIAFCFIDIAVSLFALKALVL